jgi:LPPG:FO 2-phospho-L-lactate transferase
MLLALAGGVGGAKLAAGLQRVLGEALTVVVNTGDDFEHLGLKISPDLDTVMYTLAGLNNPQTGWGVAGESWSFMTMLERLGGETWFRLGDKDLAVHVERTRRLAARESLSSITAALCAKLGVRCRVAPMSDAPVRTVVITDEGELPFQDYFVRLQCRPAVRGLRFDGAASAAMSAFFQDPSVSGIVFCPSNPYLSIQPILEVFGVRERLRRRRVPSVAVSPIVGGQAVKGPAAKIMRELGLEPSALQVAKHYRGLIDGFVLDEADRGLAPAVEALGMRAFVADTIMRDAAAADALARRALSYIRELR